MPKHLSKIQERGYESKSIQEGKEEEGIGERVDIERGRGQMSTEQAAFLLPALLPAGLPSQAPFLAVHCDTKLVVPQ